MPERLRSQCLRSSLGSHVSGPRAEPAQEKQWPRGSAALPTFGVRSPYVRGPRSLRSGFDLPTWENDFPFAGARGRPSAATGWPRSTRRATRSSSRSASTTRSSSTSRTPCRRQRHLLRAVHGALSEVGNSHGRAGFGSPTFVPLLTFSTGCRALNPPMARQGQARGPETRDLGGLAGIVNHAVKYG